MSLFRNVVFAAALSGLLAGLVLAALQSFATVPLILQAETFESAGLPAHDRGSGETAAHDHGSAAPNGHGEGAWAPADGLERLSWSVAFNVVSGIGFALILVVASELAGGLSGGECSRPDRPMPGLGNGVVFVLWDVETFGGRDCFLESAGGLAEFVRATPRAPGVEEIILPGDPERRTRERRQAEGIPIADGTWGHLTRLAAELGVQIPAAN